ncbi:PAS domain-containing sensor histidine kinase [uncultured Sunxiuqinia sp.]|uniref:sensor histidine kinase n=1 Tax=uncultured Sunxiuqinia sp. TaxID=1573825 RepID=UPI00262A7464|nr:PAS domain-containing sensor histidine kinase [uncultured Sunxiuqinia sp.]
MERIMGTIDEHQSKDELLERLREKDRLLAALTNQLKEVEQLKFAWAGNLGQWSWDVQANKVSFNALKATTLGYDLTEVPQGCEYQFFTDKLHPDDYEPVMQNMRDHLSGKSDAYEVEYRIKTKHGDWKWYYDRGTITQRGPMGEPLFLTGIVFDISERKAIEENHRALIRSLSEQLNLQENLFSAILHDLRTPLSNIIGFADLLAQNTEENDDRAADAEFLSIIQQTAGQAYDMTASLMEWAKAKCLNTENNHPIALRELIFELAAEFEPLLNNKKISLQNDVPEDVRVFSNGPILKIALRNFLSNAVKYSYHEGTILLRYHAKTLSVIDHGVGMSKEKLASLFSSVAGSTLGTAQEKGNGIGLVLVNELIQKTNIQLMVNSVVGKGTQVDLVFKDIDLQR